MARILIIDNDAGIRSMLQERLEQEGHEILQAPNGLEGIALMRDKPADLVITDVYLPEKDGLATILDLQRDFPDTKIIAMSECESIAPVNYLRTAKLFGAQQTMNKPFQWKDMQLAINEILGIKPQKLH